MSHSLASSKRWTRLNRTIGVLAVAGMLAAGGLLPTAHAAPARAGTTITFWTPLSGPDGKALVSIIDRFNSSQSKYNIKMTINPNGNYDQSLRTAIAAHKAPNMFIVDDVAMAEFADAKVLTNLDTLIAKNAFMNKRNFVKSLWNGGNYKGHQYAIPFDALPLVFYWNKAVFRQAKLNPNKPPTNEKQFLAYAKKMTKGDTYGFVQPTDWPNPFLFPTLLAQFGGKEMNVKSRTATFNSKAGVAALKLMHDWVYKYKISPENTPNDTDIKMLPKGQVGMIVDGPWQYSTLHDALGADLGVGSVPKWGKKKAVFLGQHYVGLSKDAASGATSAGALAFIRYFFSHNIEFAKTGDLPVYKSTLNSKSFKRFAAGAAIAKSLPYGVLSPKLPKYGVYNATLYPQITLVLRDKKGAKEALDFAAEQTTKAAQSSGG